MTIDTATGLEAPPELSSERVRDIFSAIARKYERFNAISSFGAYKLWLAGMMRQAPIAEHHDVLDIAGGTGDVTFTVARTKHPAHIQCTDLVPEMLDVARVLGTRHGEGDVPGAPGDIQHVVALFDGGLAHHAGEPQLVGAEAGDGVEPLVLARDGREDVAHALARELGRGLEPGGGVDGHGVQLPRIGGRRGPVSHAAGSLRPPGEFRAAVRDRKSVV